MRSNSHDRFSRRFSKPIKIKKTFLPEVFEIKLLPYGKQFLFRYLTV